MLYSVIFVIIAIALGLVLYIMCYNAEQQRFENREGIHLLNKAGRTSKLYFFKQEDNKVWLEDPKKGYAWPTFYDNLGELLEYIKQPGNHEYGYKVIKQVKSKDGGSGVLTCVCKTLILGLVFIVFASPVEARSQEEYQRLAEEYAPVLEKADAVLELYRAYDTRVNEHLLKSSNPFIRMIFMWELVNFMRYTTYMEITGQAPWLRRN